MPSNPMQRKVRNSFLLGMVIMLLVALLIGALLFMVAVKPMLDDKKAEEGIIYTSVYKLKTNVKSGETITASMIEVVTLPSTSVPSDKKISSNDGGTTIIPLGNRRARVNLKAGTILSESLLLDEETEQMDPSLRLVEYNMLRLPIMLDIGEFIDVRITFANGQDLIVVSKKEVKDIQDSTITLELSEAEIMLMTSAIVEGYILPTSDFYITKYSSEDQEAAEITYAPTDAVQRLMDADPNITNEARENFTQRFESGIRSYIDQQTNRYDEQEQNMNIETGIRGQIDAAKAAREAYLSGMSGY